MHDMLLILTYKVNKCNQNFKKCLDKILFKTENAQNPSLSTNQTHISPVTNSGSCRLQLQKSTSHTEYLGFSHKIIQLQASAGRRSSLPAVLLRRQ